MYDIDADHMMNTLASVKDLPTLPVIALEINKMLASDRTSVNSLSRIIEKDQAIVSKLLKLVNSSFFGVRSKVSSVKEAVVRLGFNSVRNVVVSVSIFESLTLDHSEDLHFSLVDFWEHSIAVAVISRYLSEQTGIQDPDDCFVAGLLHDMGLIVIARCFPESLVNIMRKVKERSVSLYDAEKEVLPIRHNKIGEVVAKKWQLPPSVCDALKYHHAPNRSAVNPELLTLVYLGDIITRRYFTSAINPVAQMISPVLSNVGASSEKKLNGLCQTVDLWLPEVKETIREACDFFIKTEDPTDSP